MTLSMLNDINNALKWDEGVKYSILTLINWDEGIKYSIKALNNWDGMVTGHYIYLNN